MSIEALSMLAGAISCHPFRVARFGLPNIGERIT
jgi:hypothetical protein